MEIILEFIIAMIATISFSILFNAPRKELPFCGLTGALGWLVYQVLVINGLSSPIASMFATAILTIFTRLLAVWRHMPGTVYLFAGMFPLVPGAGLYYTAYYLFIGEKSLSSQYASDTLLVAGSIVLGIIFGFAIPQKLFHNICKKRPIHRKKRA